MKRAGQIVLFRFPQAAFHEGKLRPSLLISVVEEKLVQLLGDPDEGLALRENVRKRLIRRSGPSQKASVESHWMWPLGGISSVQFV